MEWMKDAEEHSRLEILVNSAEQTVEVAGMIAATVSPGAVLLLAGELGCGKTTFTRGLARGLGISEVIASPSFALLHEYHGRLPLYHMDLYRLTGEDEIEDAGLADYLETEGVTVVEWPERLGRLRPRSCLVIAFQVLSETGRRLTMTPHGTTARKWLQHFNRSKRESIAYE